MGSGMDLALDLIGAAGQIKTAMTGEASRYTQISGILGATSGKVKAFNDNRYALRAQRDIAVGQVSADLQKESEVYGTIVTINQLEEANTKFNAWIDSGAGDALSPAELADMGDDAIQEALKAAGNSEILQSAILRFAYEKQPQYIAKHGQRHTAYNKAKLYREMEINMYHAWNPKNQDPNHPMTIEVARDTLRGAGVMEADLDAELAKVNFTLTAEGINTLQDATAKQAKRSEQNMSSIKAGDVNLQKFNSAQHNQGYIDGFAELYKQAGLGQLDDVNAAMFRTKFDGMHPGMVWNKKFVELKRLNNNVFARLSKQALDVDRVMRGQAKDNNYTSLKHQNETENAALMKTILLHKGKPEKLRAGLFNLAKVNPGRPVVADYLRQNLSSGVITESGITNPDTDVALKLGLQIMQHMPSNEATAALGPMALMMESIQKSLPNHGNQVGPAFMAYHEKEKRGVVLTPDDKKRIKSATVEGVDDAFKDFDSYFGPEVDKSQIYQQVEYLAGENRRRGFDAEVSTKNAIDSVRNLYVKLDGKAMYQNTPGEIERHIGGDPVEITEYYKSQPKRLFDLIPENLAKNIEKLGGEPYMQTLRWTMGPARNTFMLTDEKKNLNFATIDAHEAARLHNADKLQQIAIANNAAQGKIDAEVHSQNEILDGIGLNIEEAFTSNLHQQSAQRRAANLFRAGDMQGIKLLKGLARVRPGTTLKDYQGWTKKERRLVTKEIIGDNYTGVLSDIKKGAVAWEKMEPAAQFQAGVHATVRQTFVYPAKQLVKGYKAYAGAVEKGRGLAVEGVKSFFGDLQNRPYNQASGTGEEI